MNERNVKRTRERKDKSTNADLACNQLLCATLTLMLDSVFRKHAQRWRVFWE